ncbi:MAG: hypothetical protein ACLSH6_09305 [Limosilactobacillus pontis]
MIPLFSFILYPLVLISAGTYWLLPELTDLVNQLFLVFQRLVGLAATLPGEVVFGSHRFGWRWACFVDSLGDQ